MLRRSGEFEGGRMRKRDFVLIGVLLIVSLSLLALFTFTREDGAYVIVRVNGEEIARYDLTENGEYSINGGTNVLKIEGGVALMAEAQCPDHICIKRGTIAKRGETITCLPNRLTVTVYGEEGEVELEAH